ncbi:uncharacterized mitochondrial protein AtMg00810-like [Vigna angularis]|uniref:uncharacterized mitochondrial protein AtMg00810-like n=1 Tax=Phaseolus angularis TaxID=3914 RepID=UPI000809D48C|nr:uncharacterized mitochondrial protein AtMg00810-like [Vigna angularis]
MGFQKCPVEFGVYVKSFGQQSTLLICLYVDDLLITGDSEEEIAEFKRRMKEEYDMTDLGQLSYFLGLEFVQRANGILIHQRRYVNEVLKRFNMLNCNNTVVPIMVNLKLSNLEEERKVDATLFKQIVGSLRFLCNSRPNINFAVGLVSRFMSDLRHTHRITAKHILRYLKATTDFGLFFPKGYNSLNRVLEAWSDSDWCGDQVERKSTHGYLFKYGGASISWCSRKQNVVALSSCEVEYIASAETACQSTWLEAILDELKVEYKKPV